MGLAVNNKITYGQFFDHFPHGAFAVVKFTGGRADYQFEGILEKNLPLTRGDLAQIHARNKAGYSVYFTPNAVKEERGHGKTHAEDNFWYCNACYTDIDIEDTKECLLEEDFKRREDKKAEIAGALFGAPLPPSVTIETRNGFQAYWLSCPSKEVFATIQQGIYEYFKEWGADPAARKIVQLMRVPGFLHDKEPVLCEIRMDLSTQYEDGSFKYYTPETLLEAFPASLKSQLQPVPTKRSLKWKPAHPTIFKNTVDIFAFVAGLPILEVFRRVNGTKLTGGEIFELSPEKNGKVQLLSGKKGIPNWLSIKDNMIFSNNLDKFCRIQHFAAYYSLSWAEIADELRILFPEHKPMDK